MSGIPASSPFRPWKSNWVLLYDRLWHSEDVLICMAMGTTDATTTNAEEPRSFVIIIVDLGVFVFLHPHTPRRGMGGSLSYTHNLESYNDDLLVEPPFGIATMCNESREIWAQHDLK